MISTADLLPMRAFSPAASNCVCLPNRSGRKIASRASRVARAAEKAKIAGPAAAHLVPQTIRPGKFVSQPARSKATALRGRLQTVENRRPVAARRPSVKALTSPAFDSARREPGTSPAPPLSTVRQRTNHHKVECRQSRRFHSVLLARDRQPVPEEE